MLYEDVLVVTNIKRFTEYAGATFDVKPNTVPRPKGIAVYATIKVPNKPEIDIQLTLIQTPSGPKIVNLAVEGFVLLVNEREQWKNVIKDVNTDVGEFINKLTAHIAKIKEQNSKTS
jgi:ABC-type transporter MlaC component